MIKSKKSILPENRSELAFFGILFLYQLFFIFQGIDFTDEGFYSTFYQQIFKSPDSVQYNFMYWFSGILGGAWLHLFPWFGLLGLRVAGVLATTFTIILAHGLLKKYLRPAALKSGLLLATVIISNDPKSLFYDNLSALFFVSMICLLFEGLRENKPGRIFLCGVLLSVNTFTKLSNLADCALGGAILYHGFLYKVQVKQIFRQVLFFIAGFGAASAIFLLIMKLIGHLSIFLNCISLVREMGKSKENTHGLAKLIKLFRYEYSSSVLYAILFLLFILLGTSLLNKIKGGNTKGTVIRIFSLAALTGIFILLVKGTVINWYLLLRVITGLLLIASLIIALNPRYRTEIRLLAFMGAAMTLILPMGSDFGLYAVGRYALWIGLPIAIDYFMQIESFYPEDLFGSIPGKNRTEFFSFFSITAAQIRIICKWSITAFFLFFLFIAFTNTWNDSGDRTKMVYQVNNKFMSAVFTTQKKATAINELITEAAKYIKKDDYVLAYDEIPLFYSMTETRPFMHNSWTRLYDREVFKTELDRETEQKKIFPVVIYQKVESIKNNWPALDEDNSKEDINQPRNLYIRQYLEQNHYKLVWENVAFRIYIPS
jgi:hypothetical protein